MSLVMIGRASQDIDVKRDGVIYLGELESDKELAAIYNLAHCLFNLSLYEGFGLTILEAQRCGLPIVCSDIPVHREIAGEGASFAPASHIDQIYENLYNVSFNGDMRGRLISKALENVKRFDWQVAARQTLNLYRKIADESCDSSRLADGHARGRKNPQCFLQNIPPG
jgi:glycosyltransferase involved in cell wall biosynthesis